MFPGVKALDHAQLKLRPGTVHALMGENGAGKSTLMKCMFGICHPAYLDTAVMLHSSFNLHRMCEVDLLISPATKAFIEQLEDVSLANYKTFYQEVRK